MSDLYSVFSDLTRIDDGEDVEGAFEDFEPVETDEPMNATEDHDNVQ